MVLVFILLAIFILILTVFFLVLLSTFRVEIRDLKATNIKNKSEKKEDISSDYKVKTQNIINIKKKNKSSYAVILSLYLFNKLKWISIHFNDEKMRKAYSRMQLEKIDLKKLEKNLKLEDLKIIKKLQLKVSYLNLKIQLGTESPVITSFLVAIFSSVIAIFLPYLATNLKEENYQYIIQPIYQNQNLYKIQFNCIIQVKMVHIINVIYIFLKKGRSDLNERTTSNRRTYGYSYE